MTEFIAVALLLTGVAATAFGGPVPEIDPGTGANALALIAAPFSFSGAAALNSGS